MFVPAWNLSSNTKTFHEADAFVVSVPKSGRTWLRVFLTKYLAELEERHKTFFEESPVKKIKYTHDLWEHRTAPRWYDRIRGKWLIPRPHRWEKPKVFMVRDPRDLIVSLYFHLKKRSSRFSGTLSELLSDRTFGIEKVIETMNFMYREWQGRDNFMMFRYEDARRENQEVFRKILAFLNIPFDEAIFQESLNYSTFENMKEREKKGRIDKKLLHDIDADDLSPGDVNDPESYKVRKGKVGGYKEYLTETDLLVVEEAMQKLYTIFGYSPNDAMTRENGGVI